MNAHSTASKSQSPEQFFRFLRSHLMTGNIDNKVTSATGATKNMHPSDTSVWQEIKGQDTFLTLLLVFPELILLLLFGGKPRFRRAMWAVAVGVESGCQVGHAGR